MPVVRLRAPLSELAGGTSHEVDGATVLDVLRALEERRGALRGWILDEQHRIRVHVNVFVNGELGSAESPVAFGDVVHVLPAITGG